MQFEHCLIVLVAAPFASLLVFCVWHLLFVREWWPKSIDEQPAWSEPTEACAFYGIEEHKHEFGVTLDGDWEDITVVVRDASSENAAKRRMREFLIAVKNEPAKV